MSTTTISAVDLLEEIKQDVFRLTYVWDTFRHLYASDKKHVEVLNAISGPFFQMTQRLLFDDAILAVSRLTDPAGNKHQENVSLERLLTATGWEADDPPRWKNYRDKLDEVERICIPCRTHRNKRVSHKALNVFDKTFALPNANMRLIDAPLAAIQEFVRDISISLCQTEIMFEILTLEHPATRLLQHLMNRASQQAPDAVSVIVYNAGSHEATLHCAFCGTTEPFHYYPHGVPTPRRMVRRHYDSCHGVIGCETINVETHEESREEETTRFSVDLKIPTRDTDGNT